mmetsp:Transcript_17651/g.28891  ORF Transcript_17651/g.28891 Transcript_17651/m.28891 type:complete len:707 (-) Transcript_17651:103-2223(-)
MADDSAYAYGGGEDDLNSALATYVYPVALVVISIVAFWVQSVVTEERLVPALNIISEYFNIPDDIAGATLMAAGASSPELLCTIISLFVTHSSLGLGTIVGSEIFNQLIICAGSVYSSKVRTNDESIKKYGERFLVLDKTMVVREVGFYALSIILLYVALSEVVWDKNDEVERINISLWKACLLFGGYLLYVVVCVYMEQIIDVIGFVLAWEKEPKPILKEKVPEEINVTDSWYNLYGDSDEIANLRSLESAMSCSSVRCRNFHDEDLHQLPFIYNLTNEPVENFEAAISKSTHDNISEMGSIISVDDNVSAKGSIDTLDASGNSKKTNRKRVRMILSKLKKPLKMLRCKADSPDWVNYDVLEFTNDDNISGMRCYLWERSYFYSKARARAHAFHLRWFTITPQRISSIPDRNSPTKHVTVYPLFDEIHVDVKRLIILLVNPVEGKRDFIFIAPSVAIFDAVIQAFDKYVSATSSLRDTGVTALDDDRSGLNKRDKNADPHEELIECPANATVLGIVLWGAVFPLRLIMHYSLPDVRQLDHNGLPTASIWVAYTSTVMSLIWLLGGSYTMVVSLESLADFIGIPDSVMGVTLSAAGTSLPAYIASRIAAERGFGNQAVANVFGSNTFNIFVGLGLPWVIYCLANDGKYSELENDHILESILTMAGALVLFVALMMQTGYVVLKWHADLFVLLYVCYVTYSIGQVFL